MYQSLLRGVIQPHSPLLHPLALEKYLPSCTNLRDLAQAVAYSLVYPPSERRGDSWRVAYQAAPNLPWEDIALLELRQPPRVLSDLLLVDYTLLRADPSKLATNHEGFHRRLLEELALLRRQ